MNEEEKVSFKAFPWKCISCETIIGFIEDKKIVRIKRKDLYIEIEKGNVEVNCTRCGKRNKLIYEEKN